MIDACPQLGNPFVSRLLKVSLPTNQIVFAGDTDGAARVGFGDMSFAGTEEGRLIFMRVRPSARGAAVSGAEP